MSNEDNKQPRHHPKCRGDSNLIDSIKKISDIAGLPPKRIFELARMIQLPLEVGCCRFKLDWLVQHPPYGLDITDTEDSITVGVLENDSASNELVEVIYGSYGWEEVALGSMNSYLDDIKTLIPWCRPRTGLSVKIEVAEYYATEDDYQEYIKVADVDSQTAFLLTLGLSPLLKDNIFFRLLNCTKDDYVMKARYNLLFKNQPRFALGVWLDRLRSSSRFNGSIPNTLQNITDEQPREALIRKLGLTGKNAKRDAQWYLETQKLLESGQCKKPNECYREIYNCHKGQADKASPEMIGRAVRRIKQKLVA